MTKMTLSQGTALLALAQDMGVSRQKFHQLEAAGVFRMIFSTDPTAIDVQELRNTLGLREPFRFRTPEPLASLFPLIKEAGLGWPTPLQGEYYSDHDVDLGVGSPEENTAAYESKERGFLEHRIGAASSDTQALRKLRGAGLRPATAGELLTFLIKYQEVRIRRPLIALGTRFTPIGEWYCGNYLYVFEEEGVRRLGFMSVGKNSTEKDAFKFAKNSWFFATPLELLEE